MPLPDIWLMGVVLGSTLFTIFLLSLPSRYRALKPEAPGSENPNAPSESRNPKVATSVQVLVLGDIGRSPRMQYHAISIAKNGGQVDLIGYRGQIQLHGCLIFRLVLSLTICRINTAQKHCFGPAYLYRAYSSFAAVSMDRK
jgi:hypothetical protein